MEKNNQEINNNYSTYESGFDDYLFKGNLKVFL